MNINEIEKYQIAFRKLQANIYFDKNDLHLRAKLAKWTENLSDNEIDQKLDQVRTKVSENGLSDYLKEVEIHTIPKKVVPNKKECEDQIEENKGVFYTNTEQIENSKVDRLSIFINLPIELHIISILWLMEYGGLIEKRILKHNYGNRLFLNDSGKLGNGRILFKPYQDQFPKWWNNAITEANNLLTKEEDVTIVNLDFKSFFHTVRLDFSSVEHYLEKQNKKPLEDPIHIILKEIHTLYLKKTEEKGYDITKPQKENLLPLPVGLLTSHVLANFYMREFDDKVLESFNPVYYGRYVDDILIVFKDRILDSKDPDIQCRPITEFFNKYLTDVFKIKDGKTIKVNFETTKFDYSDLILQTNKVAIYQFDKGLSANLLNKFAREQQKRNYIFQFLSDETDEMFNEFEIDAFEESFEEISAHGSRFKPQELNKFRFAVFIAKLIRRRLLNKASYKDKEIDKIFKYFQGIHILQNYMYWEKLLTLYVVANKPDLFSQTILRIEKEIKSLTFDKSNESNNTKRTTNELKKYLEDHLKFSAEMAFGINPNIFRKHHNTSHSGPILGEVKNEIVKTTLKKYLSINGYSLFNNSFRLSGLLRNGSMYYPLIQFLSNIKSEDQALDSENILSEITSFDLSIRKYIPYRVKYHELALFHIYKTLFENSKDQCTNQNRWFQSKVIDSAIYLNSALEDFEKINMFPNSSSSLIKKQYLEIISEPHKNVTADDCGNYLRNNRSKNYFVNQIHVPYYGKKKEQLRIACVNKYVDLKHYEKSLMGEARLDQDRIQPYLWILDEVKNVPDCDLYIMPELSLPHTLLPTFISKSASDQIGFISGIEHWKIGNIGYNFVITVLPVNVEGDLDTIPVIRLKNHYAPEEEEWIKEKQIIVPKPFPYKYDLFVWKGIYFSTYYCYELADIYHRYAFFGKTDILFAPVWNKDTNFYNNIAELTSRDLHNYIVICNTSQYGDSRVIRPTQTVRRDKARVTGGTVQKYPVTLSVSDLDIKSLRDFQKLSYLGQKNSGKFKPTPPDFPISDVEIREKGELFKLSSLLDLRKI